MNQVNLVTMNTSSRARAHLTQTVTLSELELDAALLFICVDITWGVGEDCITSRTPSILEERFIRSGVPRVGEDVAVYAIFAGPTNAGGSLVGTGDWTVFPGYRTIAVTANKKED